MKKITLLVAMILFHGHCYGDDDTQEQEVILQVEEPDGSLMTRKGELLILPGARATIILAHPFKSHKDQIKGLRVLFPNCNTLVFDFRGHGERSEGQCCSFGSREVADLKAAADFVLHHPTIGHLPIIAYGQSMGASTIIETQAQHAPFTGLIVDSPFESMEDVILRGLEKLRYSVLGVDLLYPIRKFLEKYMFHPSSDHVLRFALRVGAGMDTAHVKTCLRPVSPADSIKSIEAPIFFIGCNQDTLTPAEGIKTLYRQASHPESQLWLVDGSGHVGSFFAHPEEYTKRINSFISRVIRKKNKKRVKQE